MNKLVIIDGHTFIFKAYYGFQTAELTNSKTGKPSGATFGFFKMIFKILETYKPSHFVIVFDSGTRLNRNNIYEEYKGNRKPMPQEFKDQVFEIKQIVKDIDFLSIEEDGEEADDLIGSLALKYQNDIEEIIIFSSDKDLYQILDKNIFMYRGTKGASEFLKIDIDWVEKELEIQIEQVLDYMGIVGDTADNIPGVKGIGKKGAVDLLKKFGSLEKIYQNLPLITKKSMRAKLEENKKMAFLSRELCTLNLKVPLNFSIEDFILKKYYQKADYFQDLGYNNLSYTLKNVEKLQTKEVNQISSEKKYELIDSENTLKEFCQKLKQVKVFAIDTETTSLSFQEAELVGISISLKTNVAFYIPVKNSYSSSFQVLELSLVLKLLNPILQDEGVVKVGQNIKYDWFILEKHGFELKGILFDTMIASYVLQPEEKHNLDFLAMKYFNYQTIKYDTVVGTKKEKKNMGEINPIEVKNYASEDADLTFQFFKLFEKQIKSKNLNYIFESIEMPLVKVLKKMQQKGVYINKLHFANLSERYSEKIEAIEKSIFEIIGYNFNVASNNDLQEVLFQELKLTPTKKTTKGQGFSTDRESLEDLLDKHPVIEKILEYRKFTKLNSTYCSGLLKMISPLTNRIHTSYNQTIAATGRLSSTNPNLQNIPIREKEGREIREGFTAQNEDFILLSLDYSQIELRIMAHISEDETMIEAYNQKQDIHKITASEIFQLSESQITPQMRDSAKIINFSVIYGATAHSLSKKLKVSFKEAQEFIECYKARYPKVKAYMEKMPFLAKEKGFIETIFGRKRFVSDLSNFQRIAINSPIQGTSADIIKLAMIEIDKEFEKRNLKSQIILQVHDELLFEVEHGEKEEVFNLAKEKMENVTSLKVPLLVEGKFANSWGEAH